MGDRRFSTLQKVTVVFVLGMILLFTVNVGMNKISDYLSTASHRAFSQALQRVGM